MDESSLGPARNGVKKDQTNFTEELLNIFSPKNPCFFSIHPTSILVPCEGVRPPCALLHGQSVTPVATVLRCLSLHLPFWGGWVILWCATFSFPVKRLRSASPLWSDGNDYGLSKTIFTRAPLSPLSCRPPLCATVSATTAPSAHGGWGRVGATLWHFRGHLNDSLSKNRIHQIGV